MARILLVEDDQSLARNVRQWLVRESYAVEHSGDGVDAEQRLQNENFDLIILDWELPGVAGTTVLRGFRQRGGQTPVLMLTGRKSLDDKVEGFDSGTDDYLTKPFELRELSARIKAILKRRATTQSKLLKHGDLTLDPDSHEVFIGGKPVDLQRMEFTVLEFLLKHREQCFSVEALKSRIWSSERDSSVAAVSTCISRLRKKLEEHGEGELIQTQHGVGYRISSG